MAHYDLLSDQWITTAAQGNRALLRFQTAVRLSTDNVIGNAETAYGNFCNYIFGRIAYYPVANVHSHAALRRRNPNATRTQKWMRFWFINPGNHVVSSSCDYLFSKLL